MDEPTLAEERVRALALVNDGKAEEAAAAFARVTERDPGAADAWLNLATVERALGRFHLAAEHYRKGLGTLPGSGEPGLRASAFAGLAGVLEALDLSAEAADAWRAAAAADPRAPAPLAALAELFARAGELAEADRASTDYCRAAVSVLAEKGNIGAVRRAQKAMQGAATVDGEALLKATRDTYVLTFARAAAQLPPGVRLEEEPQRMNEAGEACPVLVSPSRPFSRVRFDAVLPETGQRWMIHDAPTYGFPVGCAAAADGVFSVPVWTKAPFRALVCTRTAWDYFFLRIRFRAGLGPETIARVEGEMGAWYLRGAEGEFGEGGQGFFHFLSDPVPIGDHGLRYEIDLGLSRALAVDALRETLLRIHASEPIEVVTMGDAALPTR